MNDVKDIETAKITEPVEPKIQVVDLEDLEAVLGGATNTGGTVGGGGGSTTVSNDTTMCPW